MVDVVAGVPAVLERNNEFRRGFGLTIFDLLTILYCWLVLFGRLRRFGLESVGEDVVNALIRVNCLDAGTPNSPGDRIP